MEKTLDFNPRTREGCDFFSITISRFCTISIHAPARGATALQTATLISRIDFNPRTREGCDVKHLVGNVLTDISIHAPARGATWIIE